MVITEVSAHDVLESCRRTLGLASGANTGGDITLLASLIRRSAGIYCPCSKSTLRNSLVESLHGLFDDSEAVAEKIDETIEEMVVGGDLLELQDVSIGDENAKGTWVFAAPPSYVARPGGSFFLIGIVSDQDSYLPTALASRVVAEGITRKITQEQGEELAKELSELGLHELPEAVWLKSPKVETFEDILGRMDRLLNPSRSDNTVNGLQILESALPVRFYKGRWVSPSKQSGRYVARRPQEFGAPIWSYVELEKGMPTKLVDLPARKSRWRGCDEAWLLQMAIDAKAKHPQQYRVTNQEAGARFDFFSPLPRWAERRFMLLGRREAAQGCLTSYWLPGNEVEKEERFLHERLWLERMKEQS